VSITTFSGLLTELTRLIDGEDTSVSDVSIASLTSIIALGERRVYREARSRWNEKAFSALTTTSNAAPIPSDWEATSIVHFGGQPLQPVSEEWLREYLDSTPTGDCRYFAEAGASFMFGPAVTDGTAVQGRYFYRWPALSTTTLPSNTFFANETDLFLYAMLAESAPFFSQDSRVPLWTAKYQAIKDTINEAKNRAAYSAGRMQRRPSTPVLR
jgi:hypothetical protein